jgi:hypothetical protein
LLSFIEHTARDLLCRSGSLGTRRRNQNFVWPALPATPCLGASSASHAPH